jgi:hypothetical protein
MLKYKRLSIFYREVYQVFVRKDKAQVTRKLIILTFIPKKHVTIAITLCYNFALLHNALILSRIVITKEIYWKIKGKVFANGWRIKFLF